MSDGCEFGFVIDIPVMRQWDNIPRVRASLQSCIALLFQDVDHGHTMSMIGGELLENAFKYGHWREGMVEVFRIKVWGVVHGESHVQVSNPVEDPACAAPVFATLTLLARAESPAIAYQARMVEIATAQRAVSQLGLLRIAYEGPCQLEADLASNVLTITATIPGAA